MSSLGFWILSVSWPPRLDSPTFRVMFNNYYHLAFGSPLRLVMVPLSLSTRPILAVHLAIDVYKDS